MLTTSSQPSDYLPLASRCRSKNEFNLLHIAFENILAPAEFGYFTDLVATQQLPQQTYEWLRKIWGLSPGIYDCPQRFQRAVLADNVLLYRDPAANHTQKTLLIGFTGNARRLMMPIAMFLQCLDAHLWDVLLLRKGLEQSNYLQGVRGIAGNFPDLADYLRKAVPADKYRRVMTYGTSGGGFAAILGALLLGAARGVSVCGALPQLDPLHAQLVERSSPSSETNQFHYIYGAQSETDRQSALALQNKFGGRLHPVQGVNDHYVLKPMLKAGQFQTFLSELLA